MLNETPQWKYERDFKYEEGVTSVEGHKYNLWNESFEDPILLNDKQMNHFLANGYLQLNTKLPSEYHQNLFNKFNRIIGDDNDFNPGNNLLPIVPELNLVFDDPVIKGALQSVLGNNYMMHPHRVLHDNPPGSDQQVWHHDSYWGYKRKVHNHHPWWVMIMYYPQNTYEKIGPTGIIPGSQYIAQKLEENDISGINVDGNAGVCMMIHYDIWHRKMKNFTDLKRYMVKFEFIRMEQPKDITWENISSDSINYFEFNTRNYYPIWKSQLEWISGEKISVEKFNKHKKINEKEILSKLDSKDINRVTEGLNQSYGLKFKDKKILKILEDLVKNGNEFISLSAAYSIGKQGLPGIKSLIALMQFNDGINVDDARCFIDEGQKSELEMVCRNSAHGLVSSNLKSIDLLIDAFNSGQERIKKYICFIFGEISLNSQKLLDKLIEGCQEKDPAIRLNAVEALGLKKCRKKDIEIIEKLLEDKDDEVRFNSALALARNGKRSKYATKGLINCLNDPNRYVYGYALEALDRINTTESNDCLKKYLKITRYCPYTTFDSLF